MTLTFSLEWRPREPPLPAVAVAGSGPVAASLTASARLRILHGADLRVATADDWILVLGDGDDLPWADGAHYLSLEAGLLVPTTQEPTPRAELWRDRLLVGAHDGKLAVLLPGTALITDTPLRPADPASLEGR